MLLVFFDISDMENTGLVTKKGIYDVLKRNIISDLDKTKLKKTSKVNGIFLFNK